MNLDAQIRLAAFSWLRQQEAIHGDVLPRTLLESGFEFDGQIIHLMAPQGIFKPRCMELPLSFTTVPNSPYQDSFSEDGYLLYKYRGTDPGHRDNVGLREAFSQNIPLVYFHGLSPGRYMAAWPVFIIGDDPNSLTFKVAVDDQAALTPSESSSLVAGAVAVQKAAGPVGEVRRAYVTAAIKQRLHQRSFREKVLKAYREQCSLCRLRHYELLDAAHIIPDHDPKGVASVTNGISLCKLHHAAFDAFLIGITPEYTIQVRRDVLDESDGPMLRHGLQDLHQTKLVLPRDKALWPDQSALHYRYQQFTTGR